MGAGTFSPYSSDTSLDTDPRMWLLYVHEDVSQHARTIVFAVVGHLVRLPVLRPVLPPQPTALAHGRNREPTDALRRGYRASRFCSWPFSVRAPKEDTVALATLSDILPMSPLDDQVFVVSFSGNEQICPPLPFPSRSTKSWKWGRRGMGVSDLLPMVPIRWLDIACLQGLSFTTVSTRGDGEAALRGSLGGDDAATATAGLEVFNSLFTHILVFNSLITSVREMDDVQEIEQRSQPQIFWTQEMSACALKYLDQLVADGIRVDKGFKSSHYNQCAKVVKERFQVQVSGSQVTNHLKTWRTRWSNICNYKKISSAHFDEQTGTILLDEKNYLERVQKKTSEAKFFNKPLENYHYMAVIFGNHQATGLFAKCTSDPLGFDTSESAGTYGVGYSGDLAGHESNNASPTRDSGESLNPSGPIRDGGDSSTRSGARRKRGRMMMEDEDPLICTVTEAFKTLSDAIKQSAPQPRPIIPPNLWTTMKQIPVFEREHIAHYYGYLCENPALAYAFLEMGLDDQMVWVSRYIKTHLSD
ncbi:hypothetical protein Zm00014a_028102 [Zea mays]|uniref:Myb/SANT-like domain-containing protein n=1 Tax=Zea mays TaxID=4577 RepID=A0A3L6EPG3_MAIZE|nr:hypothetical protein Zm00014a_028102 [Zea mays]